MAPGASELAAEGASSPVLEPRVPFAGEPHALPGIALPLHFSNRNPPITAGFFMLFDCSYSSKSKFKVSILLFLQGPCLAFQQVGHECSCAVPIDLALPSD